MTAAEHPGPQGQPPGGHGRPDPLAMSPGEKVAAQWEARHDVAARGHHGTAGGVQHHLAESRAHESRAHEVQHTGATKAAAVPEAHAEQVFPSRPVRRWWRLFGRRG